MPDNYYRPDNATQPASPPQWNGQQGKLVLGGPQQGQGQNPRRPYQYQQETPSPSQQQPPSPYNNQASYANQGAYTPPRTPQNPAYNPANAMHGHQAATQRRPKRKKNGCMIGCLATLAILVIFSIFSFSVVQRVSAFGSAISKKAPFSTETGYMSTSTRTNMLVISTGGGNHDGANLTDSLVVISMIPSNQHTSLVSIPRDLWVQNPPDSGSYSKINAVYAVGSNNGANQDQGADVLAKKISTVTGLEVNHWMMIDFTGFRQFIDAIGGVDVNVPNGFSADYPKNDDPKVDASWIRVEFKKGKQHMDGETAIRYARARYNTSNPAEGTDYARSARQQTIIRAALGKMQDTGNLPKMYSAMDALEKAVRTNFSLADLGLFSKKMNLNDPKTALVGLNNQNVMEDRILDDGQWVVLPKGDNWQAVKDYVKEQLYN